MKKWIAFMLVFVLAFVLVGCKNGEDEPDEIKPKEVVISATTTTINVDQEATLSATVKPAEAPQTVVWSSKNPDIVTVDPQTGKITGKKAGTATIVAAATADTKIQRSIVITVSVPIEYDAPTGVDISGKAAQVQVGSFITLTASVSPITASQEVLWFTSDSNIATVDGGKVTGVAVGEVEISVKVVADDTITDTYSVTVVERQDGGFEGQPESVIVEGANRVKEGKTILLTSSVLPSGVSQNVVWTSSDETVATVNKQGVVTGLKEGVTYISCASAVDTTVIAMHTVTVYYQGSSEEPIDMNGYNVLIMAAPHDLHSHNPELELYAGLDKQAKQEAWDFVEDRWNCEVKVVPYPEEAPWGQARIDYIIEKAGLNAAEADIYVSTTDWSKVLADGNSILDTTEWYESYGENSMSNAFLVSSTYKGKLYGLPTASAGAINVDKGLFYNVNLLQSLGLESPASLFNQDKWSYEEFEAYVRTAAGELGEGQTVLSGKPALYWMGMVNSGGVKLVDTSVLKLNFDHQYAIQAANILRDLYLEGVWGTNAWDAGATSFNEQNSLFQSGDFWFVRTDNRWYKTIWGENTKFGYVPYPYPNNLTKDDARTVSPGGACYMQAAGRVYPTGIEARHVYRVFTELMLKTGDIMLEDAEFDEETVMRRAAERKLDDPESVTAIVYFTRDRVIFDPLYGMLAVTSNIGPALDTIIISGADYMEILDAQKNLYEARMTELYS